MRSSLEAKSKRKKSALVQAAKLDETMLIIALMIFAVSFLDFDWRPLEAVSTFVYELFFGSSDYLSALVASRENLPRAMAITSIVVFSGLISFITFTYLIPSSQINSTSTNASPELGLVKSLISLVITLLVLCAIYNIAMSISTSNDGKFRAMLYPIIMSDAGLGVITSIIITAASFFFAVVAKTIYTIMSSATKEA